jgi:hypothetical protein
MKQVLSSEKPNPLSEVAKGTDAWARTAQTVVLAIKDLKETIATPFRFTQPLKRVRPGELILQGPFKPRTRWNVDREGTVRIRRYESLDSLEYDMCGGKPHVVTHIGRTSKEVVWIRGVRCRRNSEKPPGKLVGEAPLFAQIPREWIDKYLTHLSLWRLETNTPHRRRAGKISTGKYELAFFVQNRIAKIILDALTRRDRGTWESRRVCHAGGTT